jgi:hypothetical protein
MAIGAGKYDPECTALQEKLGGGIILLVIDGARGSGFSVTATLKVVASLPELLRHMADGIEHDLKKGGRDV